MDSDVGDPPSVHIETSFLGKRERSELEIPSPQTPSLIGDGPQPDDILDDDVHGSMDDDLIGVVRSPQKLNDDDDDNILGDDVVGLGQDVDVGLDQENLGDGRVLEEEIERVREEVESFEPAKKKRKVDVTTVEVDPLHQKSVEYKPAGGEEEFDDQELLVEYTEKPRRSQRNVKKPKDRMDPSVLLELSKRERKKSARRKFTSHYDLKINERDVKNFEVLKTRAEVEKEKNSLINPAFIKDGGYEVGVILIRPNEVFEVITEDFFLLMYVAAGYPKLQINESNASPIIPGMTLRFPKGNNIRLINGKGCLARISYTKFFNGEV